MKRLMFTFTILLISFCLTAAAAPVLLPPMDNGELDRPDLPFDYFSRPTTVLGVLHGPNGTEVTPEGHLYSGQLEMGFFAGPELNEINQRVKTLERGYLPAVNLEFSIDGVNYRLQYFAVTLDGAPEGEMVNMIRYTASNPGGTAAEARIGAGIRFGFDLPNRIQSHTSQMVEQLSIYFNPKWTYAIKGDAALRSGDVVYTFNQKPDEAFIKYGDPYDFEQNSMNVPHGANDWMAVTVWKRVLAPADSFSVVFIMPFFPAKPKLMEQFRVLDYDKLLAQTTVSWDAWLDSGTRITVPEKKVNDTYAANLIYLAIAMDKTGEDYVQKVNEFQYDSFWIRDSAFILTAFGETGHPFESERGSLLFLKYQNRAGNFESQRGQLDGFGQSLWTFGRHYELTRDRAYLEKVWPAVEKSVGWLREAREAHKAELGEGALGYGLMPISNPGDNELVDGHVVGHDAWALHGLDYTLRSARDIAAPQDITDLEALITEYKSWLDYNLNEVVKRTGGPITPAIEPGGNDWGNLKLIWPTQILRPFDQRVTETLRMARYKFREGIMTYADGHYLHHYIGIDVPQSELVRGEQTKALHAFYAHLAHTSSTHGGFEWSIKPWGDRNFGRNIAPHGCFAGKFILFYRAMLVREEGNDLHIGSALSPYWLRPGGKIAVNNAPTAFGAVSFTIEAREGGATIRMLPPGRNKPDRIILHLPQGFDITAVNSDGAVLDQIDFSRVTLSPDTTRADIEWNTRGPAAFTFRSAVENYLHVYWMLHPHDTPKGALFDAE